METESSRPEISVKMEGKPKPIGSDDLPAVHSRTLDYAHNTISTFDLLLNLHNVDAARRAYIEVLQDAAAVLCNQVNCASYVCQRQRTEAKATT